MQQLNPAVCRKPSRCIHGMKYKRNIIQSERRPIIIAVRKVSGVICKLREKNKIIGMKRNFSPSLQTRFASSMQRNLSMSFERYIECAG